MQIYPSIKLPKAKHNHSNENLSIPVQQSIINTKLCSHNLLGRCTQNEKCCFAHSLEELRDPPNFYKTRLCVDFMRSVTGCSKSNNCKFAHGNFELRSTPEFYKTALCAFWKIHSYCPFGDFCRWAHGVQDLRKKVDYLTIIYSKRKQKTPNIIQLPNMQIISYMHFPHFSNSKSNRRFSSNLEECQLMHQKSCPDSFHDEVTLESEF